MKTLSFSKYLLLIILLISVLRAAGQVEISPQSVNAELSVNSQTKGLLLPRIADTSAVNSPEEGLIIYDKANKAPAFHNGAQWKSMMMPINSTTGNDSLTYTVLTGYGPALPADTYPLLSVNLGSSFATEPPIFSVSKLRDRSTTGLLHIFVNQVGSNTISIEFNIYKKGSASPYFSYKITNIKILSYSLGSTDGGQNMNESYSLTGVIYGWKDHIAGIAQSFDSSNNNAAIAY